MSHATVMVYIEADNPLEQRVRIAVDLAYKLNASLIGVSALSIPPPVVAEGMVLEEATEADFDLLRAKLAETGNWLRSVAGVSHRKPEWRAELDFPTEVLTREARSADLVIIGNKVMGSLHRRVDAGVAILKMGRPTLVVPPGVVSLNSEHVVIGWKDTREARRAVRDALMFLQEATRVTIVEACGRGEEQAALTRLADVAAYLKRHRIECSSKVVLQQEGSGAAQLTEVAQVEHADLLVTGAYGHSRLGEWIFGGMTRELLTNSTICCLMSH